MSNKPRPEPVTLDITTGRDLHQAARAVLVHASTDPTTGLDMVAVQVHDGACFLAATNRYTLGVIRHQLETGAGPAPDMAITIAAAGLRKVLRTIGRRDWVRVRLDGDGLTIEHAHLTYRLPATPIRFIDWRALLGRLLHTQPSRPETVATEQAPVCLKPEFLALFQHAAAGHEPLKVWPNPDPHAPLLITCADHFIGVLMPVRLTGNHASGDSLAAWRSDCPAPVPAAA